MAAASTQIQFNRAEWEVVLRDPDGSKSQAEALVRLIFEGFELYQQDVKPAPILLDIDIATTPRERLDPYRQNGSLCEHIQEYLEKHPVALSDVVDSTTRLLAPRPLPEVLDDLIKSLNRFLQEKQIDVFCSISPVPVASAAVVWGAARRAPAVHQVKDSGVSCGGCVVA